KEGSALIVTKQTIIPIESSADVIRELQLPAGDLMKINLDSEIDKIGYISDFYRNDVVTILNEKSATLHEQATQIQNEKEAIQEKLHQLEQRQIDIDQKEAESANKLEKMKQAVYEEIEQSNEQLRHEKQKVYEKIDNINASIQELGLSHISTIPTQLNYNQGDTMDTIEPPSSKVDFIEAIQQQIAKRGFTYDNDTIRKFYSALKANQFTILSGPSGTGKTSLVSAFAEVTSSFAKIIPVQPSWTDKQDLLGYYNPLDKQYVPSQLLDAMIEAKENKDKLYLICLDELNLAQVEYYFADILSLREQTNVSLELYSKYEYEQNMAEIRWFMQKSLQLQDEKAEEALDTLIKHSMNVSTIDQFRYTQRYNNLKRYNWKLHILENVRFIGTLNIDGTVRPL